MGRQGSCEASASLAHQEARKMLDECADERHLSQDYDCENCSQRFECRNLWDEYGCNISTGKGQYTV